MKKKKYLPHATALSFGVIMCVMGFISCNPKPQQALQAALYHAKIPKYPTKGFQLSFRGGKAEKTAYSFAVNTKGEIVYLYRDHFIIMDSMGVLRRQDLNLTERYMHFFVCKDGGYLLWEYDRDYIKRFISATRLCKLDHKFQKQWSKVFVNHRLLDIQETREGGFILSQWYEIDYFTKERIPSKNEEGIIKLTKDGEKEWYEEITFAARINISDKGEIFLFNAFEDSGNKKSQKLFKEISPFDPDVTEDNGSYLIRSRPRVVSTFRKLSPEGKILDAKVLAMDQRKTHGDYGDIRWRMARNVDGSFTCLYYTNYTKKGDTILDVRTNVEMLDPMGNVRWDIALDDYLPKGGEDVRIEYRKIVYEPHDQSYAILYERYINGKKPIKYDIPDMWILRVSAEGKVIYHKKLKNNTFDYTHFRMVSLTYFFEPYNIIPLKDNRHLLLGKLMQFSIKDRPGLGEKVDKSYWDLSLSHTLLLDSTGKISGPPEINHKENLQIKLGTIDDRLFKYSQYIYPFHLYSGDDFLRTVHVYQANANSRNNQYYFYVGMQKFHYYGEVDLLKTYNGGPCYGNVTNFEEAAEISLKAYLNGEATDTGIPHTHFALDYPNPRNHTYTFSPVTHLVDSSIAMNEPFFFSFDVYENGEKHAQGYCRLKPHFEYRFNPKISASERELVLSVGVGVKGMGNYSLNFVLKNESYDGFEKWDKYGYTFLESPSKEIIAHHAVNQAIETVLDAHFKGIYPKQITPWKYGEMHYFSSIQRDIKLTK